MKRYAAIDESGLVLGVFSFKNDEQNICQILNNSGVQCVDAVETFDDVSRRRRAAGIGMTFSAEHDAFLLPQPFPSWSQDPEGEWQPPFPKPEENREFDWNESSQIWIPSQISINQDSKELLQTLDGIGPNRAQQIIDGRPWESFEDLQIIEGISAQMIETWNITT